MSSISRILISRLVSNSRRRVPPIIQEKCFASWGPPEKPIDKKDIEFRVLKSLSKHDKIDINSISVSSHLSRDLGLDSLDLIECIVEIEDEFEVEVKDKDLEKLENVSKIVEYLVKLFESKVDQNKRPDIEFGENMTMSRPVN